MLKVATGRNGGGLERLFITGVSPITMDDVTCGFNIGANISLKSRFNEMLGFTEPEVRGLLETYREHGAFDQDVDTALDLMREWYDGYRFAAGAEASVYHTDMVLYYLKDSPAERAGAGGDDRHQYADICLEPFLVRYPGLRFGYVIELKYLPRRESAPEPRAAAAVREATAQLQRYLADERLPRAFRPCGSSVWPWCSTAGNWCAATPRTGRIGTGPTDRVGAGQCAGAQVALRRRPNRHLGGGRTQASADVRGVKNRVARRCRNGRSTPLLWRSR